jgi:porphobilinogen synthase
LRNEDLPALGRLAVGDLAREARNARPRDRAVLLFGVPESKDDEATGAYAEDGIVQRRSASCGRAFPSSYC